MLGIIAGLGVPELLIIFAIVLVLFGSRKIGQLFTEMGKGISSFKKGMREGEEIETEIRRDLPKEEIRSKRWPRKKVKA